MKKQIIQISLFIFVATTLFTSCKKTDNSNLPTSAIITSGTWRVSSFHQSADDHTGNFSGFLFTFNNDGTMTASRSSGTTNGTWSNDDSHNEFHISLGNDDTFKDISKGWLIVSKTNSEIEFEDDDATHNEVLHFEKN